MQAINIAAYQRLGDSYAEENGGTGDVDHNSNMGKDEYENLEGNSESDGGYMTPAESEPDRKAGATNYGYQTADGIENAVGHDPKSCGYQSLDTLLTNGGQSYQGNGAVAIGEITRLDKPHVTDKPTESGYLRLEGYSEFCGNPEKQKLQEQTSGYSTIRSTNDSVSEKQQLFADPDALDDEFEVTRTCYVCTFRGLLKTLQIVFSLVALGCGLVPQFWVHSAAGVWFMAVNVACPVVAASVLLAQIYREMDRCCLCQRRLVQIAYLLLIPMLLSAGLFAASISSAARDQSEFDKNMIMVAAMLTLLSLFAVITDVVMHRRMWEMFRSTGANAYIHAAFMA